MAEHCLPCLVCGQALSNVFFDKEFLNQPYRGVAAFTPGNYGSTVFDPMNGEKLEFNICDECLVKAANENKIYLGRTHRPVVFRNLRIGWQGIEAEPKFWRPDEPTPGYNDDLLLNEEDLENLPETVELNENILKLLDGNNDDN